MINNICSRCGNTLIERYVKFTCTGFDQDDIVCNVDTEKICIECASRIFSEYIGLDEGKETTK